MEASKKKFKFIKNTVAVFSGIILAVFLFALLIMVYQSQTKLVESASLQMIRMLDKQAVALSYFYSERKTDIRDLVNDREIDTFFENKALGMSMAYGLKTSLNQIERRFERLLTQREIGSQPVYGWVAFVDRNQQVLILQGAGKEKNGTGCMPPKVTLPRHSETAELFIPACNEEVAILVGIPYFFKGRLEGSIIASINYSTAARNLITPVNDNTKTKVYVDLGPGIKKDSLGTPDFFPAKLMRDSAPGKLVQFDLPNSKEKMVGVRIPIEGTFFSLMAATPFKVIYGNTQPYYLVILMLLFVFFVFGSFVVLWGLQSKALVLNTRLEDEKIRKAEMENTNRQLQDEIDMRQDAQQALKESKDRLDMALQASESGLWDWNVQTGEVLFNERWAAMLGYGLTEIENHVRAWEKLLHPDDSALVTGSLEDHFSGKSNIYQTEHRLLCKDKQWKWILDTGKVVSRTPDGKPLRAIGTHIDIHEKKMTEKKLGEYRCSLEKKVRSRTKELEKAHRALVDKALEAGRSQLSAMIFHNIGNAVTPISIYAKNLQNSEMKELNQYLRQCYEEMLNHKDNLTEYIARDLRGTDVLALMGEVISSLAKGQRKALDTMGKIISGIDYISEILTLQRSYAPGNNEIKENVNLSSLAKDALKMQEGALVKRNIDINVSLPQHMPTLKIEKSKLMQVMVNLIKNSCDAIEECSVDCQNNIFIETYHKDGRTGFRIKDTGIGIEKYRFEEIFEFGISSKGSSGFGLYYCKNFVKANNGSIFLDSPGKGQGATITIEFRTTNENETQ